MKVCRTCEVFAQTVKAGNLEEEGRSRVHLEGKEGKRKSVHRRALIRKNKRSAKIQGLVR
jgi:hypothetical protein